MKKKYAVLCCALALLMLCASFANAAEAQYASGIQDFVSLYGGKIPDELMQKVKATFVPITVQTDDVTVTIAEAMYDGRFLCLSAEAMPKDPDKVMIVPGSSGLDEPLSGGYPDKERDDNRSYLDAAKEDGKRLLMVSFVVDGHEQTYCDHFQRADSRSTLITGIDGIPFLDEAEVKWQIIVREVNLSTGDGEPDALFEKHEPITIPLLSDVRSQSYTTSDTTSPLKTFQLFMTGIATYIDYISIDQDPTNYSFSLTDAAGYPYSDAMLLTPNAFLMDDLPEVLMLSIQGMDDSAPSDPIEFSVAK